MMLNLYQLGKFYEEEHQLDRGATFLRQSCPSSQAGEGKFYSALIAYMKTKEFKARGLRIAEDASTHFKPEIDLKRRLTFIHEDRALVYIGVPTHGLQDVIGISGERGTRNCASSAVKGLGNFIHCPVEDIPFEEGNKYFSLSQQSLKASS